jgi:hypothetical protein
MGSELPTPDTTNESQLLLLIDACNQSIEHYEELRLDAARTGNDEEALRCSRLVERYGRIREQLTERLRLIKSRKS